MIRDTRPFLIAILLLSVLFPAEITLAALVGAPSQLLIPDARSQGMGWAYTAIAEGPSAGFWNPAALGLQEGLWLGWGEAQLVPELADGIWFRPKQLSVSWGGYGLGLYRNTLDYGKSFHTGDSPDDVHEFEASEYVQCLSFGMDLSQLIRLKESTCLAMGLNIKQFKADLGSSREIFDFGPGGDGSAMDLDLGILLDLDKSLPELTRLHSAAGPRSEAATADIRKTSSIGLRGGLVVKNLLANEMEFDNEQWDSPLGRFLRSGLALELTLQDLPPFPHILKLSLAYDHELLLSPSGHPAHSFYGLEIDLLGVFAIRRGYLDKRDQDISGSTNGYGIGFDFQIDTRFIRRVSARYDYAEIPQATGFSRVEKEYWSLRLVASPSWL